MTNESNAQNIGIEDVPCLLEVVDEPSHKDDEQGLSEVDVRHNLKVLVLLDAIFTMGATDLQIATGPLWMFLGASNTVIGLAGSLAITSLIGVFFSPFISLKFKYKKWYLFLSHLPYIGAWGVIGLVLMLSGQLGLTKASLLIIVVALLGANQFFGGFVSLPHQEYTAGCIPMSHRGRFSGYSQSLGAIAGIAASAVGGAILLRMSKPAAFGWLFAMTWFICQGGYVLALFGRERPVPVEKAPRPWSRAMLVAAWNDKPFQKVLLLNVVYTILFMPILTTFTAQYGFRSVHMSYASAATMAIVGQVVRIVVSGPIGYFTDRLSPKRVVPFLSLFAALAILPVLFIHSQYGVYISLGLWGAYLMGHYASFFALLYGLPSVENRAGHYTLQIIVSNAAFAVGPLLIGAACDKLSYKVTFAIVAFLGVVLSPIAKRLLASLSTDARDYA